jgi:hypothetical protein
MGEMDRLRKYEQEMAALGEKMKAEKKRRREKEKRDTQRRKLLAGAICLEHGGKDPHFRAQLNTLLLQHVPEGERYLWPELFTAVDASSTPGDALPPEFQADNRERENQYAAFRSGTPRP